MQARETVAVLLRQIAEDLALVRRRYELEYSIDELRRIADDLEAMRPTVSGIQGHGTD